MSSLSDCPSSSSAYKSEDYSITFKELFCLAASDLSTMVQVPFEEIGVLHESIMQTGTLRKKPDLKEWQDMLKPNKLDKAEKGQSSTVFGRGQLLFLVRRVNRFESDRLQAVGHRFASLSNVVDFLARSMETTREELLTQLKSMQDRSEKEHFLEPGVHLACFALRPVFQRGFDVLVRKDVNYLLPTVQLSSAKLEDWQLQILQHVDNWTVATCCERFREKLLFVNQQEQRFVSELREAIACLANKINKPFFQDARLIARPLRAPAANYGGSQVQQDACLIAFRIIADAYQESSLNEDFKFSSSKFFLVQQHAFQKSVDNDIFARRMHQELAALAENTKGRSPVSRANSGYSSKGTPMPRLNFIRRRSTSPSPANESKRPSHQRSKGHGSVDDNTSGNSKRDLVGSCPQKIFGGIHVSSEIHVDVREAGTAKDATADVTMADMGIFTQASVGDIEAESFADTLMILTAAERRRQTSPQRS